MEYRMALRLSTRPDFREGVRARLVHKDFSPHWAAATGLSDDFIAAYAPLPEGTELDPSECSTVDGSR